MQFDEEAEQMGKELGKVVDNHGPHQHHDNMVESQRPVSSRVTWPLLIEGSGPLKSSNLEDDWVRKTVQLTDASQT